MSELTVIPPGGGEVVGDSPERRVDILSDDDALHATWSRFGPGRDGADLHVHRRHTDLFYVLDGELTVRLGPDGDEAGVRAGTLVRVPPLVVHGYRNGAGAELRYLNCHAPGTGFAAYLRALRDGAAHAFDQEPPPPGGGRPAGEASVGGEVVLVDRPGVLIRLLADTPAIAWAEVAVAGGAPPPPTHVHRRHAESVFVLDGGMAVTAGARRLWMEAGSWLTLPAG